MVFLTACHFFGPIDESTLKPMVDKPDSSFFLGEWEADSFTYADLKKYYKLESPPIFITLNKNGTFQASSIPDVDLADRTDDRILANCSGKWRLTRHGENQWQLKLSFDQERMFYPTRSFVFYNHITEGLVLWDFLGDPDMGGRIMLKRQKILPTTAN